MTMFWFRVTSSAVIGMLLWSPCGQTAEPRRAKTSMAPEAIPTTVVSHDLVVDNDYAAWSRSRTKAIPIRGGGDTEKTCGTDDKMPVPFALFRPWRAICLLEFRFPSDPSAMYQATGFLVSDRVVLTAGHCVYNNSIVPGEYAQSIKVYPGKNGSGKLSDILGTYNGIKTYTNFSYTYYPANDPNSLDWDYGAILLDQPVSKNALGAIPVIESNDAYAAAGKTMIVAGYPGDRPYGTQWYGTGPVTAFNRYQMQYQIDTYGGQSGGPVWVPQGGVQGPQKYYGLVYGIHIAGPSPCDNRARIIDDYVYDLIDEANYDAR